LSSELSHIRCIRAEFLLRRQPLNRNNARIPDAPPIEDVMARFPRPRFSLKSIMLLSLGFALGYAWNLWVWRLRDLPGSEANMLTFPTYVVEPPDILKVDVASGAALSATPVYSGQHLVAMDGRINLGKYGNVYVAGMTVEQTADAIEKKLAGQIKQPKVVVDVHAYNSKVYYVIQEGPGVGSAVQRLPVTGNETVLDAIAAVGGLRDPAAADITLTRPAPNGVGRERIFKVNWNAIANDAFASLNYQIYPGDRLFIAPKKPTAAAQAKAPPAIPYYLADDVQYYQPEPPKAPASDPLPNYFMYVKPQVDQQGAAARPTDKQPSPPPPAPSH
jgi:protein involved in polysaccharide export with SLBB domain